VKIKIKLSLIVIAIVVVVAGGIAVILLRQASNTSETLSIKGVDYLANHRATYWQDREDRYLEVIRTLAAIMSQYESVPPEQRRDRFDDMMLAALNSQPTIIRIATVWKPNAVDGMDSRYIGRPGSTPTGQYTMTWGRDTGQVIASSNLSLDETMAYLNGPNASIDRVEDPTPLTVNGKDTFVFRLGVPITNPRTKEVVGTVTALLDISGIQTTVLEFIKEHEEVSTASIYTNSGFIMANLTPERVGKKLIDAETIYGDYLKDANQAVLDGKPFSCSSYSQVLQTNVEVKMVPFEIGGSGVTWTVMMASEESYILKEVRKMEIFTAIIVTIAVVLTAIIVYFTVHGITEPIVRVSETLKDISQGEGDLTRSITVNSKDEIGDLARYFNLTLEKIKKLIVIIKGEALKLSDIGNDLASNMTETAAAVNEITSNIQSIKGRVINQSASVTESKATMEQVVTNIHSVTDSLISNAANVNTLKEASETGHNGLQVVATDIQEIYRESEGLLEINSVMENIASQTNLLSMNAAIEAAHAGEAGKGFAVVADEIRKLAENSSQQSKTIGTVLKKIKESIDKITKSTENVLKRFEAIDSGVKTVAQQEEIVRNAMEEQEQGSSQVITESSNLEKITQEIEGGMNEMAIGSEQVNLAVNNVSELSGRNREGISTLMGEVSKFKVE